MTIDLERDLNDAQREAVLHTEGPVLVIAGAGSGKTRTIVYRLAHMVEQGVAPEAILLLTFTRKAAQEMLARTGRILDRPIQGVTGGTFHAFAFSILRRNAHALGMDGGLTLLDRADSEDVMKQVRDGLGLGKGDKSFPKKGTLADLVTKSRNKEIPLDALMQDEFFHLTPYYEDVQRIADGYRDFKRAHGLADYDDLLFLLDELLAADESLRRELRQRHRFLMVDEFQDTNRVQARLVRHLAGAGGNVMAVGDDAQSIYAFRGANVANILEFPKTFPGTKIIRLERNYRSTQPILDVTNAILAGAQEKFDKTLYTENRDGPAPRLVQTLSDQTQAKQVVDRVIELSRRHPLHEIAVLFRAGYNAFPVEVALNKVGIDYRKYGGMRFHEAAHVKDVLAYLRLIHNPADRIAWARVLEPIKGIGPKTANRLVDALLDGDDKYLNTQKIKRPELAELLAELDLWRASDLRPAAAVEKAVAFYEPVLLAKYPDDYPRRQAGLDQLAQIATDYGALEVFLSDLTLDGDQDEQERPEDTLVLSTVHSAKGLEWNAVLVIDLVEDRFPSKKALQRADTMEEERRLLYVACTRARQSLTLFAPSTVYNRFNGMSEPTTTSPFIRELPAASIELWREGYAGGVKRVGGADMAADAPSTERTAPESPDDSTTAAPRAPRTKPEDMGFCRHRIFGQGKVVAEVPPNKYRVNFPGFGLKVIVGDYLEFL